MAMAAELTEAEERAGAGFQSADSAQVYSDLLAEAELKAKERGKPVGPTENDLARFNLNLTGFNPDITQAPEGVEMPVQLEASSELKAELERNYQMVDPESAEEFEVKFLNWPKREGETGIGELAALPASQKVLVTLPQWNITNEHEPLNYLLERLAVEGGGPMIAVNNPSTGESSDLRAEQGKDLRDGEFGSVATPLLRALKAQGVTRIDLFGYSMGGRIAASLAAEAAGLGIMVENIVLLEAPGVLDSTVVKTGAAFMGEGKDLPLYQKHPEDARQLEASGVKKGKVRQLGSMVKGFVKAGGRKGMYRSYPKAMSRPTLALDVLKALESQKALNPTDNKTKLTLMSTSASKISPSWANGAVADFLEEKGYKDQVRQITFSGESHSIGEGAKRMASNVTRVLNNPSVGRVAEAELSESKNAG